MVLYSLGRTESRPLLMSARWTGSVIIRSLIDWRSERTRRRWFPREPRGSINVPSLRCCAAPITGLITPSICSGKICYQAAFESFLCTWTPSPPPTTLGTHVCTYLSLSAHLFLTVEFLYPVFFFFFPLHIFTGLHIVFYFYF